MRSASRTPAAPGDTIRNRRVCSPVVVVCHSDTAVTADDEAGIVRLNPSRKAPPEATEASLRAAALASGERGSSAIVGGAATPKPGSAEIVVRASALFTGVPYTSKVVTHCVRTAAHDLECRPCCCRTVGLPPQHSRGDASMLTIMWNTDTSVLIICPTGPLAALDFVLLAEEFNAAVESHDGLRGLLIDVPRFPGWEDIRGVRAHLRFVATHHRRIGRVAVVTDNRLVRLAPLVARFVLHPSIRHFAPTERTAALDWLRGA